MTSKMSFVKSTFDIFLRVSLIFFDDDDVFDALSSKNVVEKKTSSLENVDEMTKTLLIENANEMKKTLSIENVDEMKKTFSFFTNDAK